MSDIVYEIICSYTAASAINGDILFTEHGDAELRKLINSGAIHNKKEW